jgi:hypothetical protein
LRILYEDFSQTPKPYFHAGLDGILSGPFDVLYDEAREETLLLGQPHTLGGASYYDTWASYHVPGVPQPRPAFRALHYELDATILPDHTLVAHLSPPRPSQ